MPCWARVAKVEGTGAEAVVTVVDDASRTFTTARKRLRKRRLLGTARVSISDDKQHCSVAARHFMDLDLKDLDKEMGYVVRDYRQRSDGAASHFKSAPSLFAWLRASAQREMRHASWSFGAPGHGKGPWDGLFGTLKKWLRTEIMEKDMAITDDTAGRELICRLLKEQFDTEEWRASHADNPISHIQIRWVPKGDIKRPDKEDIPDLPRIMPGFTSGKTKKGSVRSLGTRSLFSYEARSEFTLGCRRGSCACAACMSMRPTRLPDGSIEGCVQGAAGAWKTFELKPLAAGKKRKRAAAEVAEEGPSRPKWEWACCDDCDVWRKLEARWMAPKFKCAFVGAECWRDRDDVGEEDSDSDEEYQ